MKFKFFNKKTSMKNEYSAQVTETIDAQLWKVWEALVTPEIIKQYFFGTNTRSDWTVGSKITFSGSWEGKTYEDKGTILANEPGKMLKYSYWSSMSGIEDLPENYVEITYELHEKDGKTLITITQDNIPSEKMKEHSTENWKMVLGGLKKLMES
jgi:uncharacterized protein YndB with AHSA1/START domain